MKRLLTGTSFLLCILLAGMSWVAGRRPKR